MNGKLILALGNDINDNVINDMAVLHRVAAEFNCHAVSARDLHEVASLAPEQLTAVLLSRDSLPWSAAIDHLRRILPDVRVITCHAFDDPTDWTELCELGAFHSVRLPLSEQEVRQSLGFVWQAEQPPAAPAELIRPLFIAQKTPGRQHDQKPGLTRAAG